MRNSRDRLSRQKEHIPVIIRVRTCTTTNRAQEWKSKRKTTETRAINNQRQEKRMKQWPTENNIMKNEDELGQTYPGFWRIWRSRSEWAWVLQLLVSPQRSRTKWGWRKKGGKQKFGKVFRTKQGQSCHREIKITHHKMIQYVHSSLGSFVQISQHFQYVCKWISHLWWCSRAKATNNLLFQGAIKEGAKY